MSEPDAMPRPTGVPVARSDDERASAFEELMRLERSQNKPPISGLAVAGVGFGLAFVGLMFVFGVFALVVAASALVFALFALPQIKHGERRGLPIVVAALVIIAAGVWFMLYVLDTIFGTG